MQAASTNYTGPNSLGKDLKGPQICEAFDLKVISSGIFVGKDNPTNFSLPLLMLQISLVSTFSAVFHFFLKPLGQPKFISDLLGGIVLGPSVFGRNKAFAKMLYPDKSTMVLDVYEMLGVVMFNFLVGVRTELTSLKQAGSLPIAIGFSAFILPLLLTRTMVVVVRAKANMEQTLYNSLPVAAYLESMTNYQVIFSILYEQKLLNSQLGRVALSSSFISGICSWLTLIIIRLVREASIEHWTPFFARPLCQILMILVLLYAIRPMMLWMIRRTPEGKTVKQSYICIITLLIFALTLYSQFLGIHPLFTSIILGLAVPEGPPLASALVEKLDCFVSAVLMPSFVINVGRKVNVNTISLRSFGIMEFCILLGYFGKIMGCLIPSLYWQLAFMDSFLLGLLLSCQGLLDIQFFSETLQFELISEEMFSTMVLMAILNTAIVSPLVKSLYNPSRRYLGYKRRTIESHSNQNMELRVLVCIDREDNVAAMIDILEASNPTRESPLGVYVLEMVELVGRAMPLFITHKMHKKIPSTASTTRTRSITGAFLQYEERTRGVVSVQCFTSIAPYKTVHDDIFTVALEKQTALIIVPYNNTSTGHSVRTVSSNVLRTAPCSVGVLVDRTVIEDCRLVLRQWTKFHTCVVFIGGPDDREALVYATRMSDHAGMSLNVVRILAVGEGAGDSIENKLDQDAVNWFKVNTVNNNRVVYSEEIVREGMDTIRVLKSLSGFIYDLVLVGRRHDGRSAVMSGLATWGENKELGIVGDILTSSDFESKASVLVLQQYASVVSPALESAV